MKPCVPLEKHCSCVPLMAVNDTFVTVSGKICHFTVKWPYARTNSQKIQSECDRK